MNEPRCVGATCSFHGCPGLVAGLPHHPGRGSCPCRPLPSSRPGGADLRPQPRKAGTLEAARSKFYVREPPNSKPNWLKVGLTLGTTAFLWAYLIKQHNEDVLEYKRRNGLE